MLDLPIAMQPTTLAPRSLSVDERSSVSTSARLLCATLMMCFVFSPSLAFAEELAAEEQAKGSASEKETDSENDALKSWQANGLPLMQTYCMDCHNADANEGGLDLTPFETLDNLSASEVKRILEMVRFGAMPPEDYDLPEIEERKQLVSAFEATMFSSACDLSPRAGRVTVRRLNRSEYNHSIRDLFGLDLRPADKFPSDEVGAGFDNNGDVLSLSPILIEKYMDAAESVAAQAIIDPDDLPTLDKDYPGDQLPIYGDSERGSFGGRFVGFHSFVWMDIEMPFDGTYRVGFRGGTSSKKADPIRVAIIDETGLVRSVSSLKYFGGSGRAESEREEIAFTAGKHRLAFVPVPEDFELIEDETKLDHLSKMDPAREKKILAKVGKPVPANRDIDTDKFPFMFRSVHITGPRNVPDDAYPPKQFQIVRHVASKKGDKYVKVMETAIKNLRPLMETVFRSPVKDEEIKPYAQLVQQAIEEGKSYHEGTRFALTALLVSPRFLFRVETPPEGSKPNEFGDFPLSQHQLATRLSYFLWSSTPDKTLLENAQRNKLKDESIKDQVWRMIKDDRSTAMATEFAAQWLGLRNLQPHDADAKKFPELTDELKQAMNRETQLLFMHVLRNNLPVREFLIADYTFVNPVLAKHYGIDLERQTIANEDERRRDKRSPDTSMQRDGFRMVSLEKSPRRGLLSHASILTLTSMPERTSPVLRGKWILENLLGTKPPDPPPGVPELEDTESADNNATFREQLELHRASPACASCHRVMDQLGFGLDDFDAIGKYRTEDAGQPIDASGALPDGRSFVGGVELSEMLGKSETETLAKTIIERLMTFAIGRELTPDDRCTLDEILEKTRKNDFRLAEIVTAIATSRQFQFQTTDQKPAP